ncbi:MAG: hypothetical protein L3K08_08000 [Thermoplasmata archaeon]|nr:hypothetical protein [Thermoplasmata archaeon]
MSSEWPSSPSWKNPVGSLITGLKIRIVASVGLLVGGIVFVMLYLAFLAERFAWYQNLAVILSALLVVPVGVLLMWVLWGLNIGRRFGSMDD